MEKHDAKFSAPRLSPDTAEWMARYVEGYILACEDVLSDLTEIMAGGDQSVGRVAEKVEHAVRKSLREARGTLEMWNGIRDSREEQNR
jgi:hypothetical protein